MNVQEQLDRIEIIRGALYEIDEKLEEMSRDTTFLYDNDNLDCVPGIEYARDVIGEYLFDLYKEVV